MGISTVTTSTLLHMHSCSRSSPMKVFDGERLAKMFASLRIAGYLSLVTLLSSRRDRSENSSGCAYSFLRDETQQCCCGSERGCSSKMEWEGKVKVLREGDGKSECQLWWWRVSNSMERNRLRREVQSVCERKVIGIGNKGVNTWYLQAKSYGWSGESPFGLSIQLKWAVHTLYLQPETEDVWQMQGVV